jgi:hypothetical protein
MSFVYILQSGEENLYKIGIANDVDERLRDLKTGNPRRFFVFGLIDTVDRESANAVESFLHKMFQSKRVPGGGREFFALTRMEAEDAERAGRAFLSEALPRRKEVEALSKEESDDRLLRPRDQDWEVVRSLLHWRENKYKAEIECERNENRLKLTIGASAGIDGLATWKSHLVARFDQGAFKLAEPDLYQAFVREARQRDLRLR